MTTQGSIVLIMIGLALVFWILDLVRRDRLYEGYGVALILSILGVIVVLSAPPLLKFITWSVGAIFPASALTLLALGFLFVILIYALTQITIVSNRLATVVQEFAVYQAKETAKQKAEVSPGQRSSDRSAPGMIEQ
jgi:hypothetical protein